MSRMSLPWRAWPLSFPSLPVREMNSYIEQQAAGHAGVDGVHPDGFGQQLADGGATEALLDARYVAPVSRMPGPVLAGVQPCR